MQNKQQSAGPIYLTASAANLLSPGEITGGVRCIDSHYNSIRIWLRRVRVTNKDTASRAVSFWIGGTGGSVAGTEFIGTDLAVAPNTGQDFLMCRMLDKTEYFTGKADVADKVTCEFDFEIGVA